MSIPVEDLSIEDAPKSRVVKPQIHAAPDPYDHAPQYGNPRPTVFPAIDPMRLQQETETARLSQEQESEIIETLDAGELDSVDDESGEDRTEDDGEVLDEIAPVIVAPTAPAKN